MIGEAVVQWHHTHVITGHHGHFRGLFLVGRDTPYGDEFLDVFPVSNYKSLEAQFIAQDSGQQMMVNVSGNSVNLAGVDHYGARSSFDGSIEHRKKIFAQVVFGNPGGSSISSGQREAVAHVVFQTGSDAIL